MNTLEQVVIRTLDLLSRFRLPRKGLVLYALVLWPLTFWSSGNPRPDLVRDGPNSTARRTQGRSSFNAPVANSGGSLLTALASDPLKPAGETVQFKFRGEQGCVDDNGVRGFNPDFRGECGDLEQADLTGADLQGKNLSGANLRRANLTRANLKGATLVGTRLTEATLTETDLQEADLTRTDLTRSHIVRARLNGAKLIQADLSEAIIRNTDLRGAQLGQAVFTQVILFGANLSGVDLSNLNWEGVEVSSSDFSESVLTGLNFQNGFADRADFLKADLRQANFTNAETYRANFIGANLQGAHLSHSLLAQANLTGAQLEQADLSWADLTRADLTDALLAQANLKNAILNEALLTGADLQNADLSAASLSGTDLSQADLRGTNLTNASVGDQGRVLATGNPEAPLLRPTEMAGAVCDQETQLPAKLRCQKQSIRFVASARVATVSKRSSKRAKAKKVASDALSPGTEPTRKNWPRFLKGVRARISAYEGKLPNFVCNQGTRRYRQFGQGRWKEEEYTIQELSYYDKQKHYKNLSGSKTPPQTSGEFGSAVMGLFAPKTKTTFELERLEKINGRKVARIRFSVPLESSHRTLKFRNQPVVVYGYEGRCWIDLQDYQVVRLRAKHNEIPEESSIKGYELWINFKKMKIGSAKEPIYLPMRVQEVVRTDVIVDTGIAAFNPQFNPTDRQAHSSTRFVTVFWQYRDYEPE